MATSHNVSMEEIGWNRLDDIYSLTRMKNTFPEIKMNQGYYEKLTIISSLQKELKEKTQRIAQLNMKVDQQTVTINRLMSKRKIDDSRMSEDNRRLNETLERKEAEFREKLNSLETLLEEYKEKMDRSGHIFTQAQSKLKEIEAYNAKLQERNEKLRIEVDDERGQKKVMIDNYNTINEKTKGFIEIFKRFWKENTGYADQTYDLVEKLKYFLR